MANEITFEDFFTDRHSVLLTKMLIKLNVVNGLLHQLQKIENDTRSSAIEKLSQIKKIKEELTKVSTEIDNIKKEITLLNAYQIN